MGTVLPQKDRTHRGATLHPQPLMVSFRGRRSELGRGAPRFAPPTNVTPSEARGLVARVGPVHTAQRDSSSAYGAPRNDIIEGTGPPAESKIPSPAVLPGKEERVRSDFIETLHIHRSSRGTAARVTLLRPEYVEYLDQTTPPPPLMVSLSNHDFRVTDFHQGHDLCGPSTGPIPSRLSTFVGAQDERV